jgi:hypothetical protein
MFWDTTVRVPGWVLRFDEGLNAEDYLPDTTGEIVALLADRGYKLDPDSRVEIERFDENRRGDI